MKRIKKVTYYPETREDVLNNTHEVAFENDDKIVLIIREDSAGAESPREWDNVGTMICAHRNYILGDVQCRYSDEVVREVASRLDIELTKEFVCDEDGNKDWEDKEDEELWDEIHSKAVVLPLYLYDHSGITMNTSGFNCPWDSGQVGVIFVSLERAFKEYGDLTGKMDDPLLLELDKEKIAHHLRGEVRVYDAYLTGNVYGFQVYEKVSHDCVELECESDCKGFHYEDGDSCWGFYGTDEYTVEDIAKEAVGEEEFASMKQV